MSFSKSCKVVHLVSRSRHKLCIKEEMSLAYLWKLQNFYLLSVLLQQQRVSEYSIESSYTEVIQKYLLKYQKD